jgi:HEPN domain-containing protein
MNIHEEWLKRARSSLELAKFSDNELVCYEDLCFQAQQAVEKGLKGLLIFYKVEPEKTHSLYKLLQEVEKHIEINNDIKDVLKLYNYAVQTRYPGEYVEITKDEYEHSIIIAEKCLKWIEDKIKQEIIETPKSST